MSVAQRAQSGKPPSTNSKLTRQDVADLVKQIRALLDAFERRHKPTPPAAPSPSAMRSQLPRRSFKSGGSSRPRVPRGWRSVDTSVPSTPGRGELHGPDCKCGMCPAGGAQ
jgi:hypothetical protein